MDERPGAPAPGSWARLWNKKNNKRNEIVTKEAYKLNKLKTQKHNNKVNKKFREQGRGSHHMDFEGLPVRGPLIISLLSSASLIYTNILLNEAE